MKWEGTLWITPRGRETAAAVRSFLAPFILLLITGCASQRMGSAERVPVTVSAANYSELSGAQLFNELNAPATVPSAPPVVRGPAKAHDYLLVPGEVYPNDVPMGTVYREVESVLEKRGYFNAEYQKKGGRVPGAIDYLLRIHYGKRLWFNPTVRGDGITWGNDGLLANKYTMGLLNDTSRDAREGLSPDDLRRMGKLMGALGAGFGIDAGKGSDMAMVRSYQQSNQTFAPDLRSEMGGRASLDFYLIVVEAFRFDDVDSMGKKAPCVWAVFIAVPAEPGHRFSDVLRAMLQTATPYFGETTHGLQIYQVPSGNVILGNPREVP
jgi:hypothetical protein